VKRFDLLIAGPGSKNKKFETVVTPYSGEVIAEVETATVSDVERAIDIAEKAAEIWRRTPAHKRFEILMAAAALADERQEEMAQIISRENGKSLIEARSEASRSGEIIRLSAFEGSQLYGDSLPLDANRGTGQEKIGFTLPQPVGVVVAISPFNYPALLVMHKIGPALAVGNAVILKPARTTPLTAIALAQCFLDAGLPEGVLSVITGSGSELGHALVSNPKVRKVSFTGSTRVGESITRVAGVKKLSLELGASSPVVVLSDADIEYAGLSAVVVCDGDADQARRWTDELLEMAWRKRAQFVYQIEPLPVSMARARGLADAKPAGSGPVVLPRMITCQIVHWQGPEPGQQPGAAARPPVPGLSAR
jgi:glyceraldehyde-3-phosphate dehydrogenase (NADP+)